MPLMKSTGTQISTTILNNFRYHSEPALRMMRCFTIGRIKGEWVNFLPPIQGGKFEPEDEGIVMDDSSSEEEGLQVFKHTQPSSSASSSMDSEFDHYPSLQPEVQHEITQKYRALEEKLWKGGYYECHFSHYLPELFRYTTLAILSYVALQYGWYCTSALFLGLMWHQLVFTAHDAGHMGITHDPIVDTTIGIVIADFIGGLSIGWWKKSHNVHHLVTNHPEHDPDIQLMPFFAVSARLLDSLTSTFYDRVMEYDAFSQFMVQFQHWTYYPILCFGRFNLYFLSWEHLILATGMAKTGITQRFRLLECVGMVFFWYWFGYLLVYRSIPTWTLRVIYVLISHIVTMPLHVQITLSHYSMSTTDFGPAESFPQKMLRTTMDVDCPPFLDFIHGGLQFQAVHHLFPRAPRHRLREIQPFVREFCNEVGVKYVICGFVEGNKEVIGRLRAIARHARMMKECHDWVVESSE
jgi:sphingolipid 8-(E)-desaturase